MQNTNKIEFYKELLSLYNRAYRTCGKKSFEIFRELSRNLIIAAAVVIAFSSPLFSNFNYLIKLDWIGKLLLVSALSSFLVSIGFGIGQYILDYSFFKNAKKVAKEIINSVPTNEDNGDDELLNLIGSTQSKNFDEPKIWSVWVQSGFLIIGLIAFFIFLLKLLF